VNDARSSSRAASEKLVKGSIPAPLFTNSSERDLRPQVIRRKISSGTRSEPGHACRDAFLGLLLTCTKLGVLFWAYLGHRLGVPGADAPYLPDLVRLRSEPA
jgi:hypothetical protein